MEFQLEYAREVLQTTPAVLNTMLRGLSEVWILTDEGAETWSPFDVIGHLIHGEETDWIPRLKTILEHGESRPFEPFDRVAFFEKSKGKTLNELLDTFAALRAKNLQTLEGLHLKPNDFALKGTHPAFGAVTLRQLLATWVVHDLGHIRQIARTMAKQYTEEVGPWKAYLSILSE
ncbi:DinB family protein [candidate division KSB1 bacterium]|nr:DinB family protein [candidate division KSB1 bacterium]